MKDLTPKEQQIFDLLYEAGPMTASEVSLELDIPLHRAHRRLSSLIGLSLLKCDGFSTYEVCFKK